MRLVALLLAIGSVAWAETIAIDANLDRHAINPLIYGVAFASTAQLTALNAPSNRWGGNTTSRYNWKVNADNKGNDWYYESIDSGSGSAQSAAADAFIDSTKAGNAQPLLTIPMIGWVAKLGAGRGKLASFSIAKYGAQGGSDWQWMPDAGNGVRVAGGNVTGNDPNDANVAADAAFQRDWITYLTGKYGTAAGAGVRYYLLDNEHSIWQGTHRDVHPLGAGMDEIWTKMSTHAAAIKGVDPAAKIVGPEEWSIAGCLLSGKDQSGSNWHKEAGTDAAAHGGMDYYPWLLQQFKNYDTAHGVRLLDVLTTHCYPSGNEYQGGTDATTQALRNRSTRAFWDPNYVDESWIGQSTWPGLRIQMIPRLKQWVATHYPGTQVGITEYNWGAENHINGATAQADIYGIFGREGLDQASRWTTPDASTPTFKAMQLYRNYDGAKSTFGETSVRAAVTNPDNVSAFSAIRASDGALTTMVINKTGAAVSCTINLSNFAAGTAAQVWQLTSSNAINHLGNLGIAANALTLNAPAQSITLLVCPPATGGPVTPPTVATPASGPGAPVTGTTASLSVLGGPAGSEAGYTYTWSVLSAPAGGGATFSPNGMHAARNATMIFTAVGTYQVQVTITDSGTAASSVSGPVTVTVTPSVTTIVVSGPATGAVSSSLQFTAQVRDQFGTALSSQPSVTWTTSSGTVSSNGLVASGTTAGTYQVSASAGGKTGSSSFTITSASGPDGSTTTAGGQGGGCGAGAAAGLLLGLGFCVHLRRPRRA